MDRLSYPRRERSGEFEVYPQLCVAAEEARITVIRRGPHETSRRLRLPQTVTQRPGRGVRSATRICMWPAPAPFGAGVAANPLIFPASIPDPRRSINYRAPREPPNYRSFPVSPAIIAHEAGRFFPEIIIESFSKPARRLIIVIGRQQFLFCAQFSLGEVGWKGAAALVSHARVQKRITTGGGGVRGKNRGREVETRTRLREV